MLRVSEEPRIMAEYFTPGVYVEEFDTPVTPSINGVATNITGFIGVAEKGPIKGAPVPVKNFADFRKKFGGYLQNSDFGEYRYLAYSVFQYFANGGTRAFVMRVAPKDAETAKLDGENESATISATSPGEWGNAIAIKFVPTSQFKMQLLEDKGEGTYRTKDPSDFLPGDVVVTSGLDDVEYNVVKSIEGKNITFVKPFEGSVVDDGLVAKVVVRSCEMNVFVTDGESEEKYENCTLNISSPSFIDKKMSASEIVNINVSPSDEAMAPVDVIKKIFGVDSDDVRLVLKGGSNGTKGEIDEELFIGKDNGPGERTGIQAFLDNDEVSLMAIPGITNDNIQAELVKQCETLGSRFAVLDMPMNLKSPKDLLQQREKFDSDYCALYHPWLKVYDPLDKKDFFLPPSGPVLGIYSRTDNARGVHKAPANETVTNCTGLSVEYGKDEQDKLNPHGVNLIRKFPGQGIRVWGARTASSKALWKYINVRRLFIYIEESIKANTNWVVFEPNEPGLWGRVDDMISTFLTGLWQRGALAGGSPEEAFYVNIGPDTMTQQDIDEGRLICVIGVAPVKPAEFVIFRITQKTGDGE